MTKKRKDDHRFIPFTDDYMFCSVMEDPGRCKEFLHRVLGIEIAEIKCIVKQKEIRNRKRSKGIRLDVYAVDINGNAYDIEMQTTKDANIAKRTRYYHSEMDGYRIRKGVKYDQLGKNVVIFVCTNDPFADGRSVYTFVKRCNENPLLQLEDEELSIFLNANGKLEDIERSGLRNLLDYIHTGVTCDEYTNELERKVEELNTDDDWRDRHMTLEMKLDEKYRLGLEEGIGKGIEQGIEQGIVKGLAEGQRMTTIATYNKCIQEGMSQEMAIRISGISEEDIPETCNS